MADAKKVPRLRVILLVVTVLYCMGTTTLLLYGPSRRTSENNTATQGEAHAKLHAQLNAQLNAHLQQKGVGLELHADTVTAGSHSDAKQLATDTVVGSPPEQLATDKPVVLLVAEEPRGEGGSIAPAVTVNLSGRFSLWAPIVASALGRLPTPTSAQSPVSSSGITSEPTMQGAGVSPLAQRAATEKTKCAGTVASGRFEGQECQDAYRSPLNKAKDKDNWCDLVRGCTLSEPSEKQSGSRWDSTLFPCGFQDKFEHASWLSAIRPVLTQLLSLPGVGSPKVPSCPGSSPGLNTHKLRTNSVNQTLKFLHACVDPDPAAKQLQTAIADVLVTKKIGVAYIFGEPIYAFEQMVPLMCALPGLIITPETVDGSNHNMKGGQPPSWRVGYKRTLAMFERYGMAALHVTSTKAQLKKLAASGKFLMIDCLNGFWNVGGKKPMHMVTLSHGVDDDGYYMQYRDSRSTFNSQLATGKIKKQPQLKGNSLLYVRTATRLRQTLDQEEWQRFDSQLNKSKPNLLVVLSLMNYGWAAKTFWPGVAPELKSLSRTFNLIVRGHPLNMTFPLAWGSLGGVIVDSTAHAWSQPSVEVADVILGRPSGVVAGAVRFPKKPLVVMSDFKQETQMKMQQQLGDAQLGPQSATMVFSEKGVANVVQQAYADAQMESKVELGRRAARQAYFRTRLGCVDGLEDYRTAIEMLAKNFKVETNSMVEIYTRIALPDGVQQQCVVKN